MPKNRYPWGTASPAGRIRETTNTARNGLAAAKAEGLDKAVAAVKRAARGSQSLTEALDYLSRAGLRAPRRLLGPWPSVLFVRSREVGKIVNLSGLFAWLATPAAKNHRYRPCAIAPDGLDYCVRRR